MKERGRFQRLLAIGSGISATPSFDRGLNASKCSIQACAEALHNRDDRQRYAGGDKAVFDSGRTGLILHKAH